MAGTGPSDVAAGHWAAMSHNANLDVMEAGDNLRGTEAAVVAARSRCLLRATARAEFLVLAGARALRTLKKTIEIGDDRREQASDGMKFGDCHTGEKEKPTPRKRKYNPRLPRAAGYLAKKLKDQSTAAAAGA